MLRWLSLFVFFASPVLSDTIFDHWGEEIMDGKLTVEFSSTQQTQGKYFDWYFIDQTKPTICLSRAEGQISTATRGLSPAAQFSVVDPDAGPGIMLLVANAEQDYGELWFTKVGVTYCLFALFESADAPT